MTLARGSVTEKAELLRCLPIRHEQSSEWEINNNWKAMLGPLSDKITGTSRHNKEKKLIHHKTHLDIFIRFNWNNSKGTYQLHSVHTLQALEFSVLELSDNFSDSIFTYFSATTVRANNAIKISKFPGFNWIKMFWNLKGHKFCGKYNCIGLHLI